MENQRRNQLLQRKQELLNQQNGSQGAETRRQYAQDRVQIAEVAKRTPGFPKPLQSEVDAAERDLKEATEECERIIAELQNIEKELADMQ